VTNPAHRTGSNRTPRTEAFYVRIVLPDGTTKFTPATEYIGREMPFDKPRETCAVRVYDDVVTYSLLHISKRRAASLQGKVISMPSSMLTRLSRRSTELGEIGPGMLIVEREDDVYPFRLELDESKVASLEYAGEGDEPVVELDPRGERLSVYLRSPVGPKVLALAFIGHLGKPGTPDTVARCAAKVLNAAVDLPPFQMLADIETVVVPSKPGSIAPPPLVRSAFVDLPARLFTEPGADGSAPQMVAAGTVGVEIDLQHANHTSEKLLFKLHPDESLAESFEPYREICNGFVATTMQQALGDELRSIAFDIVLGDVDDSTVERLRDTLQPAFAGVDLTPSKFRAAQASGV